MTSLDEKILAMTEKVECLWFDWYAASCSFANQQIIAIHLNKGSLLKNVLFLAACETQVTTHCFAVNVPIASSCKMKVVEHEREDLCAAAIYLFEFEFVSPLASYQPACYKHYSCSNQSPRQTVPALLRYITSSCWKVECLGFDRFAASWSFDKQQIIAIHLNNG